MAIVFRTARFEAIERSVKVFEEPINTAASPRARGLIARRYRGEKFRFRIVDPGC